VSSEPDSCALPDADSLPEPSDELSVWVSLTDSESLEPLLSVAEVAVVDGSVDVLGSSVVGSRFDSRVRRVVVAASYTAMHSSTELPPSIIGFEHA